MGEPMAHVQAIDVHNGLFANRPDYGTSGKQVQLSANYFDMAFQKPNLIFHIYEMTFKSFYPQASETPEKELTIPEGKKLVQVVRCALKTSTFVGLGSDIATDFSNKLISCKRLDKRQMDTGRFEFWAENEIVKGEPKPRKNAIRFQMFLAYTQELHVSDLLAYMASDLRSRVAYEKSLPIIQAFDIILGYRAKFSLEVATPKQGKVFPQVPVLDERFQLESPRRTTGYLQGVFGFFASVRATTDRTLVNCNACCGAFYKPEPLKHLFAMFITNQSYLNREQCMRLESTIRGLRVELTHLKDEKNQPIRLIRTIFGLVHPYSGPRQVNFFHEGDKRSYTVAEYWAKQGYGSSGNDTYPVVNVGNQKHPTFVPAEACEIYPGQMAKKRLDSLQNNDMINHARRDPGKMKTSIETDAFKVLELENNSTLKSFGVSLGSKMVTVQGRKLGDPSIVYNNNNPVRIDNKARWNLRTQRVCQSKRLEDWGIIWIKHLQASKISFNETVNDFIRTLRDSLGNGDVDHYREQWTIAIADANEHTLNQQFQLCKSQGLRLLVVVLPDSDPSRYRLIKKIGDIDCGISTVCMRFERKKFEPKAVSYFANVALKINLKLGGINHKLRNQRALYANTMVIGVDVTHPSPGATKKTAPSVAAMVASVDSQLGQWLADLRINKAGQEMVELLSAMLRTRLEAWKSRHGNTLPENLLIYRDGVSESQYKAVLDEEVSALRTTCKLLYAGRRQPKITLIIVGKRHHTRFFRHEQGTAVNPNYGTVVDGGVTEARNWDFFLQSHHALLGTARPAHYFVLLNEIFTKDLIGPRTAISDYLHQLTYEMCFLFGRSTGPVSIPPPVYYAHLACERSRCYGEFDENISDTSSMTGDDRGGPEGGRGVSQLSIRGPGYGSQPGPSNPKKEDASKKQQQPTESRTPDLMAKLSKKERAKRFEENAAAASQRAAGASSQAEGKKPEAKPETKAEGKKPQPPTEGKAEGKKPQPPTEGKAEGKKPQPTTESKAEGKGKGKAEGKLPEKQPGRKQGEERTTENTQSKAQGKKPEQKAEGGKPEPQAKQETPKEMNQIEIHEHLAETMFFI